MSYPHELETWWLAAACRATGSDDHAVALQRLEAAAGGLSDRFTVDRPAAFRDYSSDPVSLAAYGILFFPQTFARMCLVLGECLLDERGAHVSRHGAEAQRNNGEDRNPAPPPAVLQVLDLGSGAGASTLAAASMLRDHPLALHAADHAPGALAALRQVFDDCRTLWPAAALDTHLCDVRADALSGSFDLILASFVLNELFPDGDEPRAERWLRRQLERLAPGGRLVVIEPAGAATCERLQRLRDRLAGDPELAIVAPCPHRLPCPMLGAACGFCHDVRTWRVPDSVNLINRRMFRSVHDLKHGLLVVRRAAPVRDTPATLFRLVGPMHRAKGRLVTRGCCGDGTLREIERMTRNLPRAQLDALAARERGELLRMVNGRLLGDGRTWRAEALEQVRPEA
jgi:SAM-dependent methyltransferase